MVINILHNVLLEYERSAFIRWQRSTPFHFSLWLYGLRTDTFFRAGHGEGEEEGGGVNNQLGLVFIIISVLAQKRAVCYITLSIPNLCIQALLEGKMLSAGILGIVNAKSVCIERH